MQQFDAFVIGCLGDNFAEQHDIFLSDAYRIFELVVLPAQEQGHI